MSVGNVCGALPGADVFYIPYAKQLINAYDEIEDHTSVLYAEIITLVQEA